MPKSYSGDLREGQAWPATLWVGTVPEFASPWRLAVIAAANSFVLVASYFGVAALAWGLADATMDQPRDFEAPPESPSEQRRWRPQSVVEGRAEAPPPDSPQYGRSRPAIAEITRASRRRLFGLNGRSRRAGFSPGPRHRRRDDRAGSGGGAASPADGRQASSNTSPIGERPASVDVAGHEHRVERFGRRGYRRAAPEHDAADRFHEAPIAHFRFGIRSARPRYGCRIGAPYPRVAMMQS